MSASRRPRAILLTGASSGIGAGVCRALLERGDQVWGTSRKAGLPHDHPHYHHLVLDLADEASIRRAVGQGVRESGGFDVVINNAGEGIYGSLEALTPEESRRQFEVLFFGPLLLCTLLLPSLRARGGGLILNVTSLAARFPIPFMGAYSAAKAALASATEVLRLETQGLGIRIVDLQPGDIRTEFHEATRQKDEADSSYARNRGAAWKVIDHNMRNAPSSECVVREVLRLIDRPAARAVAGECFQTRIAPLAQRLLPHAWVQWAIAKYYGLK
jgi:NAD(P)-dependent dehydrogenase (short-subunit alcohol dehydrogenase family)